MKSLRNTLLATAIGGLFATGSAIAGNIPMYAGALNQLSDNSAEFLINGDTSTGATTLDMGDRLHGIFTIETVENLSAGGQTNLATNSHELTGVFDITVVGKTGSAGSYSWVFAATTSIDNTVAGLGVLTGTTAGTAAMLFQDTAKNYTRIGCATTAACEATATDGSLWAALGFGANSYWTATAITDDISVIHNITPPANGGGFNSGLDFFINNTGYSPEKSACFDVSSVSFKANDVCGSGSLLGVGGANTPFDSFDNVDFTVKLLPEPGSLALLGISLAGLAGVSRRRSLAK